MGQITRKAVGEEVLILADCPACGSEVNARECGYTTFNPGWVECKKCNRKWSLGWVNDVWDVGKLWNKRAAKIRGKLTAFSKLKVDTPLSISRNFADEKLDDEAATLLAEFKESIIGADKTKGNAL